MNELEKIIVEARKKYHEKVLWKDGSNYVPTRNCLVEIELEAKAIEQFVVKARIEELEEIKKLFIKEQDWWFYNEIVKRIENLKKELK